MFMSLRIQLMYMWLHVLCVDSAFRNKQECLANFAHFKLQCTVCMHVSVFRDNGAFSEYKIFC